MSLRPAEATPARPRTQAERRETAQRRIVDAAIAIVASRGLDELTLAEAGEAAGYSRGLAAHYFGSREALIAQIAEQIVARYRLALRATAAGRAGLAGVLANIRTYIDGARQAPKIARALHIVLGAAISKPALAPAIAKLNREVTRSLAEQIAVGIARGEIGKDVDPEAQAALILAGLRGVVALWLVNPRGVDLRRVTAEFATSLERRLAR
jgi:AcrR family transcriptional regulator